MFTICPHCTGEEGVQNSNYAVQNRSQQFNRNSNLNNPHSMLYAHIISNRETMHSMPSTVLHLLKKLHLTNK